MFPCQTWCFIYLQSKCVNEQTPVDYNKHLKCMFGKCGQAHLDCIETNDTVECTIDAICLCPSEAACDRHVVVNLNTGKHLTCAQFVPAPLTAHAQQLVEAFTTKQGAPELKI